MAPLPTPEPESDSEDAFYDFEGEEAMRALDSDAPIPYHTPITTQSANQASSSVSTTSTIEPAETTETNETNETNKTSATGRPKRTGTQKEPGHYKKLHRGYANLYVVEEAARRRRTACVWIH